MLNLQLLQEKPSACMAHVLLQPAMAQCSVPVCSHIWLMVAFFQPLLAHVSFLQPLVAPVHVFQAACVSFLHSAMGGFILDIPFHVSKLPFVGKCDKYSGLTLPLAVLV